MTKQKLVFIDTNIFVDCAVKEIIGSDIKVLDQILEKLKKGEVTLVVPENIKVEIIYKIGKICEDSKKLVEGMLQKGKTGSQNDKDKIAEKAIAAAEKTSQTGITMGYKKSKRLMEEIFKNKNTKEVKLTDSLIIAGMKRSLLKKYPFTAKKSENAHTKDQDCIAFEALLSFLRRDGKPKSRTFIFCATDQDYFSEEGKLYAEIENELKPFVKKVVVYKDPVDMLKKEFGGKYTKEQEKKYKEFQSPALEGLYPPKTGDSIYDFISRPNLSVPSSVFTVPSSLLTTFSDSIYSPIPTVSTISSSVSQTDIENLKKQVDKLTAEVRQLRETSSQDLKDHPEKHK